MNFSSFLPSKETPFRENYRQFRYQFTVDGEVRFSQVILKGDSATGENLFLGRILNYVQKHVNPKINYLELSSCTIDYPVRNLDDGENLSESGCNYLSFKNNLHVFNRPLRYTIERGKTWKNFSKEELNYEIEIFELDISPNYQTDLENFQVENEKLFEKFTKHCISLLGLSKYPKKELLIEKTTERTFAELDFSLGFNEEDLKLFYNTMKDLSELL